MDSYLEKPKPKVEYEKLCWWILHDLSLQEKPISKREIRHQICQKFETFADEEIFLGFEQLTGRKYIDYDLENQTYDIRKEGMDLLRNTFDRLVINGNTAQFFSDREMLQHEKFCKGIVSSTDKIKRFSIDSIANIHVFHVVLKVLFAITGQDDIIIEIAQDILNRIAFIKRQYIESENNKK